MRIAIFGTGGVGGYFGGRLALAGQDVTFFARGSHLAAMQAEGLRVESVKGSFRLQPVQATDTPEQAGTMDAVLVGVKAWQVAQAAQKMRPLVGEQTVVLPLQNGVEAAAQLADVLGAAHVLGGYCLISSFIAGPGVIRHMGVEPYIFLNELDNQPSPRVERLRDIIAGAGVNVEVPADIHAAIWRKFMFIASISGICAVARMPADVARSVPETRQLIEQAVWEIIHLGRARGVALPDEVFGATMDYVDTMPVGMVPSMARDIELGRPSELSTQSGAVARLADTAGVAVPVHTFVYHSLLPLERRARGEL